MISLHFQIVLIATALINLVITIFNVKKAKLKVQYSILWLFFSAGLLLIAVFPRLVKTIASLLGIYSDTNALFLFFIAFIILILFSFSIAITRLSNSINRAIQEIALLNKEVEDLKKQNKS